jgi:hypothetical protein
MWIANLFNHVFSEQQSEPAYGPERRIRDDNSAEQRRRASDRPAPTIAIAAR